MSAVEREEIRVTNLLMMVEDLRKIIGATYYARTDAVAKEETFRRTPVTVGGAPARERTQDLGYEWPEESHYQMPQVSSTARTPARTEVSSGPTIGRPSNPDASPSLGTDVSIMVQLYNSAVDNRNLRTEFRGKFQPLRISTINAPERRRDPNLPAEFRESSEGSFFAVKLDDQSDYLVLLGFDVAVKHTSVEAGAIGQVFVCPDYDPNLSYLSAKVRRPAVFKVSGQNWELRHQGVLDLGSGE